jgi:tripartite-type tricarboxylate transporter receptor subunit TctC
MQKLPCTAAPQAGPATGLDRRRVLRFMGATACALAARPAPAADWPKRALNLVIGFSKNSSSELVATALAEPLAARLGVPVNIDIVPGKAGTAAAAKVAASNDGHTIGIVVNNALTVADLLDPSLGYKPARDLVPLAFLTEDPMVLVSSPASTSTNAAEFLLAARSSGGKWLYGSQGVGSIGHLAVEYLGVKAGVRATHHPFAGGPETAAALKSNQIQFAVLPVTLAIRLAKEGHGKIVAVTSRQRSAPLPEVPSLHESGVLGFDYRVWTVAIAPKNMPEEHAQLLSRELGNVMKQAPVTKKLAAANITVASDTSANQAAREIQHETALLGGILMMRGLQPAQ